MPSLSFIGLGLCNELGITLRGLEIAKKSEVVMLELYTNFMPELNLSNLKKLLDKEVIVLKRADLEENSKESILNPALTKKVSLLVPGDPMVATTHVALRLQAEKMGIRTNVINAPSIISSVAGATGLQIYKFGRTITIPFNKSEFLPSSIISFLIENEKCGLHTLALLDIDTEKGRYMIIKEAIQKLLATDEKLKLRIIDRDKFGIGMSNVGSKKMRVKAGKLSTLMEHEFESPPQSIVFPSKLHFLEAEALQIFCKADKEDLEGYV